MAKSFSTIVQQMLSFIRSRSSKLDVGEGTILNDIVVSAPSQEFAKMYEQLEIISNAQAIDTANLSGLEKLANNFGLVRKEARKAQGTITFFSTSAPTSDVTIPSGTVVGTVSSTSAPTIQFVTTRAITMFSVLAGTYLNPATGVYEISTDIEAAVAGESGVVGSGNITTLVNPVSGIDGCYNALSTAGGVDSESEEQLRVRISAKIRGTVLGTEDGLLEIVLAEEGVDDASVVGHGDTGRDVAGAVDIYIKGRVSRVQSDTFFTTENLVLTKQPVLTDGVISVISSGSGSLSNWTLSKDTSVFGGSVSAQDAIVWSTPINASYGTIFVSYSYNGLVEDLQALFLNTNKDILNTSLLIKWATELAIDVTCSIKVLAGFDTEETVSAVSTAIALFLDGLALGEEVQQADVAREILNTPGVDDVTLPFTTFRSSDSSVTQNSQGNLVLPNNAYASAGTLTINLIT